MPSSFDPHRDYTGGTFEDSFLYRFGWEIIVGGSGELIGLGLRLVGWGWWQLVRLVCTVIFEGLSTWHS